MPLNTRPCSCLYWNQGGYVHQNWCACMLNQLLLAWFFWVNSIWLNFLTTMDYIVHGPKGKFGQFDKQQCLQNRRATPNKIAFHAFYFNLYLHKFFEPILFFGKGNLRQIWRSMKRKKISETWKTTPTKLGIHVHLAKLSLSEFLSQLHLSLTMYYKKGKIPLKIYFNKVIR